MAKKKRAAAVKLTKTERKAIATVNKIKTKLKAEKSKAESQINGINAKLRELDK